MRVGWSASDTPKSAEAEGTNLRLQALRAGEGVVNETQPGEACAWPAWVVVRDLFREGRSPNR